MLAEDDDDEEENVDKALWRYSYLNWFISTSSSSSSSSSEGELSPEVQGAKGAKGSTVTSGLDFGKENNLPI